MIEFLRTGGGGAVAGGAWTRIAETILGAPAPAVTFAGIPGTYRSLVTQYNARGDGITDADFILLRANADAGGNYDWQSMVSAFGAPTGAGVQGATSIRLGQLSDANSADADIFTSGWAMLYNYTSTAFYKHVHNRLWGSRDYDGAANRSQLWVSWGHWKNAGAAITSLTYLPSVSANFVAGSQFVLYGIT